MLRSEASQAWKPPRPFASFLSNKTRQTSQVFKTCEV